MSMSLLDRLQQKVNGELDQFMQELAEKEPREILDHAYELAIKCQLTARIESAFMERNQVKGLLEQEHPLQYIYDQWEHDAEVVSDLLTDTVYAAGQQAERAMRQKASRKSMGEER